MRVRATCSSVAKAMVSMLAVALISLTFTGRTGAAEALQKIRVIYSSPLPLPSYAYVYVGQYLGDFKKAGLDVDYTWASSSTIAIQQVVSGNADIYIGAFDSILVSAAKGQDLKLQAVYSIARANQVGIIVRAESPVERLKDLKNKVVGVTSLTAAYTVNFLNLGVKLDGGNPDTMNLVSVGSGAEAANALTSGRVAALAQADTSIAQIRDVGVKIRELPLSPDLPYVSGMIVARRDFVERNPELLTKYMQLIIKGSIFAIENPEAVVRIAWSMYPEIKPKDLPEDVALRQGIGQVAARSQSLKLSGGDVPVWGAVSDREWNNYVAFLEIDPGKLRGRETYLTSRLLEKAGAFDQAEYTKWARAYRFPQAGDNRGG